MLLQIITAISDFLWGTPMTVALVGTGLYLGIRFGFRYNFRKIGFNFRNTFGKMFKKGEGTGTVSGFAAACTAMANTIGVGNIVGVATAPCSGCGCRASWACPPRPVRSFWGSATGSSTANPWTSTCATGPS